MKLQSGFSEGNEGFAKKEKGFNTMSYMTVEQYANRTKKSKRTIYNWMKSGKINSQLQIVNGKPQYVILLDSNEKSLHSNSLNEVKEIEAIHSVNEGESIENESISSDEAFNEGASEDVSINETYSENLIETFQQMYEDYKLLAEKNIDLAREAGASKFLTTSEELTKNQYFETLQENKTLLQKVTKLETIESFIKEELQELKEEKKFATKSLENKEHQLNSYIKQTEELNKIIVNKELELKDLKIEVGNQEKIIQDLNAENKELASLLSQANSEIESLKAQNVKYEEALETKKAKIEELNKEKDFRILGFKITR